MKKLFLILALSVCGCGTGLGKTSLAEAKARCNESRLAGTGNPMTDAEWDNLVATHERARDTGLSYDDAITFGNFTCGAGLNELCVQCNIALVDALWP